LTTGARFILHHHRRAEFVFELVGQGAGHGIGAAARWKTDQQFDGLDALGGSQAATQSQSQNSKVTTGRKHGGTPF